MGEGAKINRIISFIDRLNEILAKIFCWCIIIVVLTLCYEVFMRYMLNKPTMWSFDVTYMLNSLFVVMGIGYTLQKKGHVSVDIFFERFSHRARAIINIILYLALFFFAWVLITRTMFDHVVKSWEQHELALIGTLMPPIYPFKTWVFLGLVLFILQGLSEFLKNIQGLRGKGVSNS